MSNARDLDLDLASLASDTSVAPAKSQRLAIPLELERSWSPDQTAMVAALRVVLGLPRQLPDRGQGGVR
jgi:hypothetical protein